MAQRERGATGGDGPVTGDEVRIDATFIPALMLPAGHCFFVPQVLLGNANHHFLCRLVH